MEKRFRTAISIILFIVLSNVALWATTTSIGENNKTPDSIGQTIYGYYGDVFTLEISKPIYTGDGFNLNVNDTSNENRTKLAPTATPLSTPGLEIGTFSLVSSNPDITLKITHTPLTLHYDENGESKTAWVDWELCVSWEKDGEFTTAYCLSSNWDSANAVPENLRIISIPLNDSGSVARLVNSGMYFRLTSSSAVSKAGKYIASVIFEVDGL